MLLPPYIYIFLTFKLHLSNTAIKYRLNVSTNCCLRTNCDVPGSGTFKQLQRNRLKHVVPLLTSSTAYIRVNLYLRWLFTGTQLMSQHVSILLSTPYKIAKIFGRLFNFCVALRYKFKIHVLVNILHFEVLTGPYHLQR